MTLPANGVHTPAGDASVFILALMMVLVAGLGVSHEEMLQDTLKSMIVSLGTLTAGIVFFWQLRTQRSLLTWHRELYLPLLLMIYALGSMVWSHTYLAGVEAIRWFIVVLLGWLCANTLTRERLPLMTTGIHMGATIAALWAALQFWFNFGLFPQGPPPASTFVNRNFLAEFLVTSLPLSVWLWAQVRTSALIRMLALSNGLCVLAILMTGTRSALIALMLLLILIPAVLYAFRANLEMSSWTRAQRLWAGAIFLGTVLGLGSVGSGHPQINAAHDPDGRVSALERSLSRSASIARPAEYSGGSFALRINMWRATMRMIADRPWSGVGAGAWEVDIPLYQPPGIGLESDYYAHNEILQLLGEYGLAGWIFLAGMALYLCHAAWRTWRQCKASSGREGLERAVALGGMLALLVVSGAGFPWRLAGTGALLAVYMGWLAAANVWSDVAEPTFAPRPVVLSRGAATMFTALLGVCLVVAAYISYQAAVCERKLVRAVSMGLAISNSGVPGNVGWQPVKAQMLKLMHEGIEINPHYRKITPMLADELAHWGDWKNALWIWESVIASRPYVPAILTNIGRAHLKLNEVDQAQLYFERARKIQPTAASVRTLEVLLLYRTGRYPQTVAKIKTLLSENLFDPDVIDVAYEVARKTGDSALAIDVLMRRKQLWPEYAVDSWLKLGNIYAQSTEKSPTLALEAFREALKATPSAYLSKVRERIPMPYREQLQH